MATFGHVRRGFGNLLLVMALLGAIGVESALAEPIRAASALRNLSCCARNCTMLRGVVCQTDCCSLAKHREIPTISARADGSMLAQTLSALPVAATVVVAESSKHPVRVASVGNRGDPQSLLLQTHTLRL